MFVSAHETSANYHPVVNKKREKNPTLTITQSHKGSHSLLKILGQVLPKNAPWPNWNIEEMIEHLEDGGRYRITPQDAHGMGHLRTPSR